MEGDDTIERNEFLNVIPGSARHEIVWQTGTTKAERDIRGIQERDLEDAGPFKTNPEFRQRIKKFIRKLGFANLGKVTIDQKSMRPVDPDEVMPNFSVRYLGNCTIELTAVHKKEEDKKSKKDGEKNEDNKRDFQEERDKPIQRAVSVAFLNIPMIATIGEVPFMNKVNTVVGPLKGDGVKLPDINDEDDIKKIPEQHEIGDVVIREVNTPPVELTKDQVLAQVGEAISTDEALGEVKNAISAEAVSSTVERAETAEMQTQIETQAPPAETVRPERRPVNLIEYVRWLKSLNPDERQVMANEGKLATRFWRRPDRPTSPDTQQPGV